MIHKHPFFGHGPIGYARRGYHHGRLKDALIEAARVLIAEHGPSGFTLAEAAKRVGVTGAAPYRHFADRNDLIGELARRGFELFGESLAGAWDEGKPDARIALKRMGRAYLAFARAEPGLYSAMFNEVKNLAAARPSRRRQSLRRLGPCRRCRARLQCQPRRCAPLCVRTLGARAWHGDAGRCGSSRSGARR